MTAMEPRQWTGMCVGGPKDGQVITHWSPNLQIVFDTKTEPTTVTYRYEGGVELSDRSVVGGRFYWPN